MQDTKAGFVTYFDADLMFYNNPESLFEFGNNVNVLIQPNNFSANEIHQYPDVGYYCAGWDSFRNNTEGKKVVEWWHKRCVEWCCAKFEEGKFGGQKYLDDWKSKFKGVREITDVGASIAPWNVNKYDLSLNNDQVYINEKWPLIYYHFHSFRMNLSNYKYVITGDRHNDYSISKEVEKLIYKPYIDNMKSVIKNLKGIKNYRKYTEVNPKGVYKVK